MLKMSTMVKDRAGTAGPQRQKLLSKPAKTEQEIAQEEYQRQLELAIENH
jgi:hypothetical protein